MLRFFWPVLLIIMGVHFLQEDIRDKRDDAAFRDHGESAMLAPIQEYTRTIYSKRDGVNGGQRVTGETITADLQYTTKSGQTVVVPAKTLTPVATSQLEHGVAIQIQYLPESPQTIRLPGAPDYDGTGRVAIYAMLFGGVLWFVVRLKPGGKRAEAN